MAAYFWNYDTPEYRVTGSNIDCWDKNERRWRKMTYREIAAVLPTFKQTLSDYGAMADNEGNGYWAKAMHMYYQQLVKSAEAALPNAP